MAGKNQWFYRMPGLAPNDLGRGWFFPQVLDVQFRFFQYQEPGHFPPGVAYLYPFVVPVRCKIDALKSWGTKDVPEDEHVHMKHAIYATRAHGELRPFELVEDTTVEIDFPTDDLILADLSDNELVPGLYWQFYLFETDFGNLSCMFPLNEDLQGTANSLLLMSDGIPNDGNDHHQALNWFAYKCEHTNYEEAPLERLDSNILHPGSTPVLANTTDWGLDEERGLPVLFMHFVPLS